MNARVRPARPADKDPLMSFIKDNWGGHDYIPQEWDEWLEDKEGRVFVVEADGVPVGMSRVKFLKGPPGSKAPGSIPVSEVAGSLRCWGAARCASPWTGE